ncbi:MAG: cadherin domain-containing protein [Planctomycetaceae bacterium]
MSKARNSLSHKIESLEPMILMSASSADFDCIDGDDGTPDQGSGDAPGTLGSGGSTDDDGTPDQGSGDAPGTLGSGGSTDDDGTPDQGSGDAPGIVGSGGSTDDDGTPDQGSGDAPGTPVSGGSTDDDGTPDQGSGDAPGTPVSGGSTDDDGTPDQGSGDAVAFPNGNNGENLAASAGSASNGGDDVLIAQNPFETVRGGDGNDVITGTGGDNHLFGDNGDDLLMATKGFNVLDGGAGTDTAKFIDGNRADFSVIDLGNGIVQISDGNRVDNVTNVELFQFADGTLTLDQLLNDGNDAPVVTTAQHLSLPENTTFVANIAATDADGDTLTYSIADAADGELFTIDPVTGALSFKNAPDFENPLDEDGDNVYDVTIKVSDGKTTTLTTLWVQVTNVDENGGGNQSPFFTNISEGEMIIVNENTTAVRDIDGQDPDGDTVTYSFSDGINIPGEGNNQDPGRFNLDPNTGVLSFKVAPDFENPGDADGDNEYRVTLVITDGKGGAQERSVVIKVADVTEGGTNQSPYFTNVEEGEMVTVFEGNRFVGDANGTDPDGDAVTYSIAGGVDASLFIIDPATGVLSFAATPDFENPTDADGNNQYELTLRISDGSLTQERNIVVKVLDVNEGGGGNRAPFFTNVEEGEIVTVPENTTLVGDANGVDPDGDAVTYSIVGGADAALFTVDSATGVVSFINAPDFENPGDADGNNNYQITLRISDGSLSQDRNVTVKVTNVNDGGTGNRAPFFTNVEEGEIVTVPENTTLVGDANGIDPDGDAVTYSIVGGADAALFTVDPATGVVSFINAPDFENPGDADGNNNYQITLRISDGSLSQDRNVTVKVTNVNDGGTGNRAPFFTNVEEGEIVTVPENTTLVGDANGVDPDGDAVTYSIVGGADAALFTVDPATGVVSFINAPDFENPGDADGNNNYQITLRISDGSLSQDRNVTVRVTNVNDGGTGNNQAPFFTNVSQGEYVNVLSGTTLVGDANGVDPNGDPVTYSISGGADAAFFTINPTTGVLSFINAPDVNNPLDAGGNNLYDVRLRISDGSLFQDRDVVVCVVSGNTGGNRAPVFLNVEQGEVVWFDENHTFVGDANGYDADGDALTYSIVGGADGAKFTINPTTGELYFLVAPDFENPTDAGRNNLYDLVIRVSDGTLFQDRTIAVNVEDIAGA